MAPKSKPKSLKAKASVGLGPKATASQAKDARQLFKDGKIDAKDLQGATPQQLAKLANEVAPDVSSNNAKCAAIVKATGEPCKCSSVETYKDDNKREQPLPAELAGKYCGRHARSLLKKQNKAADQAENLGIDANNAPILLVQKVAFNFLRACADFARDQGESKARCIAQKGKDGTGDACSKGSLCHDNGLGGTVTVRDKVDYDVQIGAPMCATHIKNLELQLVCLVVWSKALELLGGAGFVQAGIKPEWLVLAMASKVKLAADKKAVKAIEWRKAFKSKEEQTAATRKFRELTTDNALAAAVMTVFGKDSPPLVIEQEDAKLNAQVADQLDRNIRAFKATKKEWNKAAKAAKAAKAKAADNDDDDDDDGEEEGEDKKGDAKDEKHFVSAGKPVVEVKSATPVVIAAAVAKDDGEDEDDDDAMAGLGMPKGGSASSSPPGSPGAGVSVAASVSGPGGPVTRGGAAGKAPVTKKPRKKRAGS